MRTAFMVAPPRLDLDDVWEFLLHANQKVIQQAVECLRLLDHREMATAFKHMQCGVWQRGAECFAVLQGHDAIQTPPDEAGLGTKAPHLARQVSVRTPTLH